MRSHLAVRHELSRLDVCKTVHRACNLQITISQIVQLAHFCVILAVI